MALTTPVLRRLAWITFGLSIAGFTVNFVVDVITGVTSPGWGTGGRLGDELLGFVLLTFPVAGILVTLRQPRNRIGWLLLAIGIAWGTGSDAYVHYALSTRPPALPRPDLVGGLTQGLWVPAIGLTGTYLILLFPDGKLPSPRWRIVGWASGISMIILVVLVTVAPGNLDEYPVPNTPNPFGIAALRPFLGSLFLLLPLLPICIVACAAGLVVRFRRSRGVERLQLKWLAAAGAIVALIYLVTMACTLGLEAANPGAQTDVGWLGVLQDVALLSFGLIPAAIGVAILRYRLYEIDIVINRALVFGALAVFISGVYVAIVVGVGAAVGQRGEHSLALSVAATAVVAVAFGPVRERVQRLANRLVYGQRATPYEVLSDFAGRMGGSYPAVELLPQMAATVGRGLRAERVAVWLKVASSLVPEGCWPGWPGGVAPAPIRLAGERLPVLAGDRVVPVVQDGELLGAIVVVKPAAEPVTPAEDKLLADVAAQAGLVLRNVRLIEELRGSRQRLVAAQDAERRRLERNLHDGAQQSLVSVALLLRMARTRLAESDPTGRAIDQAADQLKAAIEELRELARGIHPAILTERGLGPAIGSLAERSAVPTTVEVDLPGRLPATVEGTVYFVVAEALANIGKYAQASHAQVNVTAADGQVQATITDDGIGGADPTRGSGLTGLADRVAAVNGTLTITSPPGTGTTLTTTIPIPAETGDASRQLAGVGAAREVN